MVSDGSDHLRGDETYILAFFLRLIKPHREVLVDLRESSEWAHRICKVCKVCKVRPSVPSISALRGK